MRNIYFKILILFFVIISCKKNNTKKPNIVIFFTDDQGYADLSCYGANFQTPNIDTLAKEGIQFTNFYSASSVCTPSRAALLTGRYPKRMNLHKSVLFPFSKKGLEPEEVTIADILKENGYKTACIGKWHLGHKKQYLPNFNGFDYFYGVPYSNDMHKFYYAERHFQAPPLPLYRDTLIINNEIDQRFLTRDYTYQAITQIKKYKNTPFFIYLSYNMPHVPLTVSPKFKDFTKKGLYADAITEIDWSVGEVVKTLKEKGIYNNTILIFTSDNGPDLGNAYPLKGRKTQTWEGGMRVPGIITWKDKIKSNQIRNDVVSTLDILPTLSKISGATLPKNRVIDGLDLSKYLINDKGKNINHRPFYFYADNGQLEAVRLGKWKLHTKKLKGWNKKIKGPFPLSLYNLKQDIEEKNNIARKFPKVVSKLHQLMENFDKNLK